MKLANNILFAVALVATSEAMTMSGKAGIPDDAMLEILNNGTGRNFATMASSPKPYCHALSTSAQPSRFS